jgi:hypothetical protein
MATARKTPAAAALLSASEAPGTAANPATNTQVAVAGSSALALPGGWAAKLAAEAKEVAAEERPSVSKIGLRAGQITYGGNPVKGNVLPCIILAAGHRNVYYDKPFDPNNLQNPACFALSVKDDGLEAHPNVPNEAVPGFAERQERSCGNCPLNQWESDPKGGKGKACKETRRLVIVPADAADDAESCKKAEMAIIDVPVTSGKNYSNFVNGLAASASVPPWVCITNVSTSPNAKTQFQVNFTPVEVVQDEDVLTILEARKAEAERLVLTPYDEPSSTESGKMASGTGVSAPAGPAKKQKF